MTDDTVTATLAQWAALTEAATEGPWHLDAGGDAGVYTEPRASQTSRDIASAWRREDEALIAASRTAMPALLGFVEDVRALHVSSPESRGVGRVDLETGEWGAYCDHDGEWWPCATAQAAQKWLGGA